MRRAEKRGKELPPLLKAALEAQADGKLLVTSEQDFKSAGFIGKASPSAGNIGFEEEVSATLKAEQVTHVVQAEILDMAHANDVIRECGEVSPTLQARMGTGGNQIPLIFEPTYCIQGNTIDRSDTAGANGKGVIEGKSYTLNTVDRPAVAYAVGIQPNNSVSADGLSDIKEKSPTLSVTKLAGVCYARSGFGEFVESETTGILRASAAEHGVSSQDVVAQAYTVGNGQADNTKLHDVAGALNCMHDQQSVMACYSINTQNFDFCYQDTIGALCARDYKGVGSQYVSEDKLICEPKSVQRLYIWIVRRLTPLECERLQGYPDDWTLYDTKGSEIKDTPRYKACGNSIAIPCAARVFQGIVEVENAS